MNVYFHRAEAYGIFRPETGVHFGGAGVRSVTFAKALSQSGKYNVSFFVGRYGEHQPEIIDGINVLPEPSKEAIFQNSYNRFSRWSQSWKTRVTKFYPGLALDLPVLIAHRYYFNEQIFWTRPYASLKKLTDSVICCFGTDRSGARIISSCKAYGIPSILFTLNMLELSPDVWQTDGLSPQEKKSSEVIRTCLKNADYIVVQTEDHQRFLKQIANLDSTVIRNPISLLPITDDSPGTEFVLWIGRTGWPGADDKRPHLYWELARRLPEIPFLAILNPSSAKVYAELVSAKPPNLTVIDRVPFHEIDEYYHRSAFFCNTSPHEGFPNAFLQAANHLRPIASLSVDPDGMLSQNNCGTYADSDFEQFVHQVRTLWTDIALRQQMGLSARRYIEDKHNLQTSVNQLDELLQKIHPQSKRI